MSDNPYQPPIQDSAPVETPPSSDDRLWATLAHLAYFVLPIFGALVIWLVKKDESEFVAEQSLEALNFQLTVLIVSFATALTFFLIPLTLVIGIAAIVYCVMAAIQVNKGVRYKYQYIIRLVK